MSGFIEAEGCFSIRKNNNHSFSIGQNDDIYLINAIKQFFGVANAIRNPYLNFYSIEIYKKVKRATVIDTRPVFKDGFFMNIVSPFV